MMALSGVRSSWLMVARKRVLAALACSASVRASLERLLLHLAVGDVAHHRDDFAPRAARRPRCSSGRQRISTQMKSAAIGLAAHGIAPHAELDAARLAAARGIRQAP